MRAAPIARTALLSVAPSTGMTRTGANPSLVVDACRKPVTVVLVRVHCQRTVVLGGSADKRLGLRDGVVGRRRAPTPRALVLVS
jgi:hypothetical protein